MENEEKKEVKNHQSSSSMHPISVFLCLSILICCPKAFNLPFPVGIPFSFVLLLNVVLLS